MGGRGRCAARRRLAGRRHRARLRRGAGRTGRRRGRDERAAPALARGPAPVRAGLRALDGRRARRGALEPGEPTESVLLRLRARAGSHAWDTLIAAVLLQRDAGGDLASLLRELAASGEAADRAERDARAATAQARFTAWIVFGLPPAGALLAELAAPGFAASLLANPLSAWFAILAALLQLIALVCIGRLTRRAR